MSLLLGLVNAVLGPLLHLVALAAVRADRWAVRAGGERRAAGCHGRPEPSTWHVGGFGGAMLGALVISVVTTLLELVLRPLKSEQ